MFSKKKKEGREDGGGSGSPRPEVGWADGTPSGSPAAAAPPQKHLDSPEYAEAVSFAEMLLRSGQPELEELSTIKVTLRAASKSWLEHFYEAGGLTALVMKLSDVEVRCLLRHSCLLLASRDLAAVISLGLQW